MTVRPAIATPGADTTVANADITVCYGVNSNKLEYYKLKPGMAQATVSEPAATASVNFLIRAAAT